MMTPVLSRKEFQALGAPDLVYVREISAKEILDEATAESIEEFHLVPDQTLFALYGADGQRLAVLVDRESAFAAALAHELAPVSVH